MRILMILPVLLMVLAIVLVLGSCATTAAREPRPATINDLAGDWMLTHLEETNVASLLPAQERKPTLNFAVDGKVTGFTAVNRLSSSVDLKELERGRFKLGPAITTRMAGSAEAMEVEHRFTSALQQVDSAKIAGSTLTLMEGDRTLLTLVRGW